MKHEISPPHHVPEQIAFYQGEHLLTHDVCRFDPERAAGMLQTNQEVLAVDIGGDKIRSATYSICNGHLEKQDERAFQSRGGAGYLMFLEDVAEDAISRDLRVGISSATKLERSVVTRTVNLPLFFAELSAKYDADYENLFPGRSFVANDTIMGICGASTRLVLQGTDVGDVAFFICGSGLGASVIKDHATIHVEAAHVPLANALNPLGQTTPCGVEGRNYVCPERVVAGRAGIEDIYLQQTGESRDGVALGKLYEQGDELATVLFETSSLALAHAITGVTERYSFPEGSIVVLHGGIFELVRYRDTLSRCLERIPHAPHRLVYSRDLSTNVCLDGAAITAVYHANGDR